MNERLGAGVAVLSSAIGACAAAARCLVGAAKACVERRRQRHFLATLGEHALRDIGLSRGQVRFESERPRRWPGPTARSMPPALSSLSSSTRPWPMRPW